MEIPLCQRPGHAQARVVRAGWQGKEPHRRQRWLCRPSNGDPPHRFLETLPRQESDLDECLICATRLEVWEGQNGPRDYAFAAREIAHALSRVAEGESYQKAALSARKLGDRIKPGVAVIGGRRRNSNYDGQIVANWIDVFGPVITDELLPTEWPGRIAVDSRRWVTGHKAKRAGMGFHVMAAVAYVKDKPVTWKLWPSPRKTRVAWEQFFGSLQGTPRVIVSDADRAIRAAAANVFPQGTDPAPDHRLCEHHLAGGLRKTLPNSVLVDPRHPIMIMLSYGFSSPGGFQRLYDAITEAHANRTPRVAGSMRWLGTFAQDVRTQVQSRPRLGPHSTGAVEGSLRQLHTHFIFRAQLFTNRQRVTKLLDLMTLGLNGQVDELAWADRIRDHLLARAGKSQVHQRQFDDPAGAYSLIS